MFEYPRQAEVNRVLPKTKIYAHSKASRALKDRFVREVDKIVWRYKLAPESINLPAAKFVKEIQVFDIIAKGEDVHEDVLRAIDRTIRHPVAFQVKCDGRIRYVMTFKRANEASSAKWVVDDYFGTDWRDEAGLPPLPPVTSMQSLYEAILGEHLPLPPKENEALVDRVERISLLQKKQREAQKLEAKLAKERQFNRKVEINQSLRSLNREIEALYTA